MKKSIRSIIEDRRNYYERMDKIGYKQKWVFAKLFGVSPSRLMAHTLNERLANDNWNRKESNENDTSRKTKILRR